MSRKSQGKDNGQKIKGVKNKRHSKKRRMKHHTPQNNRMKIGENELGKSRSHVMRENDDDVALLL